MAIETLRPTNNTGSYTTPANAYDNNDTTYAYNPNSSTSHEWNTFDTPSGSYSGLELKVTWEITEDDNDDASLTYSLNGGSTWLNIRALGDCVITAKNTSTIVLSSTQDISQVKVASQFVRSAPLTGSAQIRIYEIWLEGELAEGFIPLNMAAF